MTDGSGENHMKYNRNKCRPSGLRSLDVLASFCLF